MTMRSSFKTDVVGLARWRHRKGWAVAILPLFLMLVLGCGTEDEKDEEDEAEDMVTQTPISFRVRNTTDETRCVSGDYIEPAVALAYTTGAGSRVSDKYLFYPPHCTLNCREVTSPEYGCTMDCLMASPSLEVLPPGEEIIISSWNGHSYNTDNHPKYCMCYDDKDKVLTGPVSATVCAFTEYTCDSGQPAENCPPENNHIDDAEGSGTPQCFGTEFTLPTTDTEIEIVLGE